jgi:tetratricopeptide (TPR) repeat protein
MRGCIACLKTRGDSDLLLENASTDMDVFWTNKGRALAELGNWSAALECFDRALQVNSNYGAALSQRAFALKQLQK